MSEPSSLDLPEDAPQPRLCHIVKWPHFEGYGFNLHGDKHRPGQYIGKIDKNSPAEAAGLLENDRIVEVNGVNIANENHKQVVERIRTIENETKLLVIDPNGDKWYKDHNIIVDSDQSNVKFGTSLPTENGDNKTVIQNGVDDSHSVASSTDAQQTQSPMSTTPSPEESLGSEVAESTEKISAAEEKATESDNSSVEDKPEEKVEEKTEVLDNAVEEKTEVLDNAKEDNTEVLDNAKEEKVEEKTEVLDNGVEVVEEKTEVLDNGVEVVEEKTEVLDNKEDSKPVEEEKKEPEQNGNVVTEKNEEETSADVNNANVVQDKTDSPTEKETPANNVITSNGSAKQEKGGLNLNMTAAQMRAQLSQKKKVDPRKDSNINLKEKYQIIQNM